MAPTPRALCSISSSHASTPEHHIPARAAATIGANRREIKYIGSRRGAKAAIGEYPDRGSPPRAAAWQVGKVSDCS
jgi:hypothetical protein